MDRKTLLLWMCILTALAGMVNAISIFGYDGTTVSHLTGLVSKVAINITEGNFEGLWGVLRVILLFFILGYFSKSVLFLLDYTFSACKDTEKKQKPFVFLKQ